MVSGDLVIMPGESLMAGDDLSVGLVVDVSPKISGNLRRVGVIWNGESVIDWEPADWLEVISETR